MQRLCRPDIFLRAGAVAEPKNLLAKMRIVINGRAAGIPQNRLAIRTDRHKLVLSPGQGIVDGDVWQGDIVGKGLGRNPSGLLAASGSHSEGGGSGNECGAGGVKSRCALPAGSVEISCGQKLYGIG